MRLFDILLTPPPSPSAAINWQPIFSSQPFILCRPRLIPHRPPLKPCDSSNIPRPPFPNKKGCPCKMTKQGSRRTQTEILTGQIFNSTILQISKDCYVQLTSQVFVPKKTETCIVSWLQFIFM